MSNIFNTSSGNLFKRIKTKLRSHALILGYRQISNSLDNPINNNVQSSNFSEQMEVLQNYTNPISLNQLLSGLNSRRLKPRSVAITFDYGYADIFYRAKPIMEKNGLASTIFIDSANLNTEYWWDKLIRYIISSSIIPEEMAIITDETDFSWRRSATNKENSKVSLFKKAFFYLLNRNQEQREDFFNSLQKYIQPELVPQHIYRIMNKDEVQLLARNSLFEFGTHYNSCPSGKDMSHKKKHLEDLTGFVVNGVSLSNKTSVITCNESIRSAGYNYSCSETEDAVYLRSDPYNLHRVWVPDLNGEEFQKFLFKWVS